MDRKVYSSDLLGVGIVYWHMVKTLLQTYTIYSTSVWDKERLLAETLE